ncbi:MAG: type II toxin-antitoxin system HicB family antitoxin [Magnetococcales bacterium]|nr:type II toxin-antitoxin system HicB family antitoxin [Nitrospirota bacterium]
MIDLEYTLVIEVTDEVDYFGFYSPELDGFSGIGYSVEDCINKAKLAMQEHVSLLKEQGLPIPHKTSAPEIIIRNEHEQKATLSYAGRCEI